MTLQQALDTIKELLPFDDLILNIHFNTEDDWTDATISPRGDPGNDLAAFCGDGDIEIAIIHLAEQFERIEL
ncbi:MAG: hypothetical protein GY743_23495 [Planctomycetaceae bacterium]|nr:hypothetical protein [Planctomycetaceae bacterium]